MKINLISRDNGAGLSTDMGLLQGLLVEEGHEVARVEWTDASMPQCDVGIFLELFNPRLLPFMERAIGIFNPEWFMPSWSRFVNNLDQVWSKSVGSYNMFAELGHEDRTHLTGFLSRDMMDASAPRKNKCLHLKGHSELKNTPAILQAWRENVDLPELVIVSNNPVDDLPGNTSQIQHASDAELKLLLNECSIHICPSRAEGWGHYITEGLSVGATVITTDASPMNEQVHSEWGILIKPYGRRPRGLVLEYDVDPSVIAESVRTAIGLAPEERDKRAALARQHIQNRNEAFRQNAIRLLGEL